MALIGSTLRHDEAAYIRWPRGDITFAIQWPKIQEHLLEVQCARRLSLHPRCRERYPVALTSDTGYRQGPPRCEATRATKPAPIARGQWPPNDDPRVAGAWYPCWTATHISTTKHTLISGPP